MSITREKFVSIQVLRFIAASAVILAHLHSHYPKALEDGHPLWGILNFGAAGVDLFFVISGFVMVYSSEKFFRQPGATIEFLRRRLIRIVPLYWICTTFLIVFLATIHHGITIDDLSPGSILGSYLFIPIPRPSGLTAPALGVGWSLNFEMLFYALFAFAVMLPRFYAVVAVSVVLYLFVKLSGQDASGALTFYHNPRIYQFVFGMVIGLIYSRRLRLSLLPSAIMLGAGVWMFIKADALPAYIPGFSRPYAWGIAFAMMLAACVLCKNKSTDNRMTKTLNLLGDSSYALYLTHSITLMMMTLFPIIFSGLTNLVSGVASLLIIPLSVCVLVAVLTHLLVEKPVTRQLNKWFKPRDKDLSQSHQIQQSKAVSGEEVKV